MFKDKKCPHCGRRMRSRAVFCLDCGRSIEDKNNYIGDATGEIVTKGMEGESLFAAPIGESVAENLKATSFLTVTAGPDREATIELTGDIIIGRWRKDNNVVLSDPYISRQHLKITSAGGRHLLENMSKTNGTKVNGDSTENHILQDGDVIEIGYTVMVFRSKPGKK